jgi:hypothetical protein
MGFSAEMKAFLNAYQVGQKINASRTDEEYKRANTERTKKTTERENDAETLKTAAEKARADLELTRKRIGTVGAGISERRQLMNERILSERARRAGTYGGAGGAVGGGLLPPTGAVGEAGPIPQGQGVLPIGPSTMVPEREEEVDPFPPGSEYNRYADGGLVPDDEEEDDALPEEAMETQGVLPTTPQPATAPTDVSAQSRRRQDPNFKGIEGVIAPAVVADAVRSGMTFGARESGLAQGGAVASPRTMAVARQIASGAGGLSEQEMQAAKKAVDPDGKLTESQRNMAALGSVYQYWANQGDGRKAEKVAFQMLQYYRNAAQRYAAIAAKAAEGGNVDLATKAALKAYQNIPDGNDLALEVNPDGQLVYQITGPKGETIRKGVATPQQLAASAMGMATGGFDKALLSAAGAREADAGAVGGRKGAGAGRQQSASDRETEEKTAMGAVEKLKTNWAADEKNKDKKPDEAMWEQMGNVATHIMQQNKVTSMEAARAADILINPKDGPKGKADFKLRLGENEGDPATITFGNGMKLSLDDNQLDQIQNARATRIKEQADKDGAAAAEAAKPNKFVEGAKLAGGAIANDARKFAGEVKGAIGDETLARAGSAVTAGKRALDDLGAVLTDPKYGHGEIATTITKKLGEILKSIPDKVNSSGAIPVDEIGPAP